MMDVHPVGNPAVSPEKPMMGFSLNINHNARRNRTKETLPLKRQSTFEESQESGVPPQVLLDKVDSDQTNNAIFQ